MSKHRLMLSAAAAALLTAGVGAVRADTEISTNTSTALSTTNSGSITIDAAGSVAAASSSTPAILINSNNFVLNNGIIANNGVDTAIGVEIDTSAASLFPASTGFASTGTIDVGGGGTGKRGILITGGHTFYGPITLTTLTASSLNTSVATQASSLLIKGDSSAAFLLDQGTSVTSNILLGGSGIIQNASDNSTQSNSIMAFLNGTVNGNFILTSALSGTGPGLIGIETLGGIHSCASDTAAPSGFTCPTGSVGAFINAGSISLIGTSFPSSRGNNPEAGSALIIGNSIDGGVLNSGPGTSSNLTSATMSTAGIVASGVVNPTVLIDPSKSITGTLTAPRSSIVLGPLTADIDPIDPGYSFVNRGTISAQPLDSGLSAAAIIINGTSSVFTTCLSSVVGSCDVTTHSVTQNITAANGTTTSVTYQAGGGLLNTGTVSSVATTNQLTGQAVSATAIHIGDFATVPRIDVKAETITGTTNTAGSVSATASGIAGGSAFAISMSTNANVPVINVGRGATITAAVNTSTVSPTKDIATSNAPFTLFSEAIVDASGTLKTINNAGTIQAVNTILTPQTGATVANITRAIDLASATTGAATINNSGKILGDVLFGSAGNSDVLNVGNVGSNGTANAATGVINTPTNYAVVAQAITNVTAGVAPQTTASTIDFGSGLLHTLHIGGYGYVNANVLAGAGALDVLVDSNGILFLANSSQSLQANNFTIANNGTLGLTIAQANLNSLNPVVQANSATLSGANLSLQFGSYVSSSNPTAPTEQVITLLRSPTIVDTTLATQNAFLGQATPFLFESPASAGIVPAVAGKYQADNGPTPLTIGTDATGQQVLLLHLKPRAVGATNVDGSPGLNLTGDAARQFPFITNALATDSQLGAAVASSMTVYNTPGQPGSGINVGASQQAAEQVFSQFAPDVSGGTREIAIMLTDQATGPVAARQRVLRDYSKVAGEITLWGQEFAGHINNKGRPSGAGTLTSYKDHGFGFAVGVDAGSPRNGWYGGAFTFYSGDVSQLLPRATKTQTEWYMLSGYTNWTGKHLFLDTHLDAAYGNFEETRTLTVGALQRFATSKRPGAMLSLGANAGMITHFLRVIEVDPHISLDGMTLREEGYTEANGGSGFNLAVAPYFANSLRTAVGTDFKSTFSVWDIDFTPNARIGYRYDLLHQPVKIKAAFDSTGGLGTTGNTLTFVGPDPDSGNVVAGLGFGAGTDTWKLGIDYDWVRGNNGSTTQVGTIHVLGRI